MQATEIKVAEYGKDIQYMKDAIEEIRDDQKDMKHQMISFIESADKKFAPSSLINDVLFLRNLLVTSILGTIAIAAVTKLIFK